MCDSQRVALKRAQRFLAHYEIERYTMIAHSRDDLTIEVPGFDAYCYVKQIRPRMVEALGIKVRVKRVSCFSNLFKKKKFFGASPTLGLVSFSFESVGCD